MKRTLALFLILAAAAALAGERTPLEARARAWSATAFRNHSAVKQLPKGFVLPAGDIDLKVSSLVAADIDADGDLDIVAARNVNGSLGIFVWLNDGDGRLTRQHPAQPKTLGSEPEAPSVREHQAAVAPPIQPETPAIRPGGANAWLALPGGAYAHRRAPDALSATPATVRSRAPPVLS